MQEAAATPSSATSSDPVASSSKPPARRVNLDRSTPKTMVADDKLQSKYTAMAQKFVNEGINVEAIKESRVYFTGLDHSGPCQAKLYCNLDSGGLPANAVRILVLPVSDSPQMSSAGAWTSILCSTVRPREPGQVREMRGSAGESIAREVANKMPVGLQVFKNKRSNYHVTLFHTSKIFNPRPDAIHPSGGVVPGSTPASRPPPTQVRLAGTLASFLSTGTSVGHPLTPTAL